MRISTKISLSLSLMSLVVFGGLGLWQLSLEKRDLERAALVDATTLARAAAESVRQDLTERNPQESLALLESLEGFDSRFDAMLWSEAGSARTEGAVSGVSELVDAVSREATGQGGASSRIVSFGQEGRVAVVAAPIDPEATSSTGAIVLVRPLDDVDADLRREGAAIGLSVFVFSLLGGLFGFALGERYIGRPLARLDRAMAVVGAGDFEVALAAGPTDEVGRVLRRFNEMRSELQAARSKLETEEEAHRMTRERIADLDRLVTVGQLSAGLAHEIGSPLQVLRGRAEKLQERAGDDATLAASAQTIADQARRIERIVNQLLHLARPRNRELRTVDPSSCVGAVVDLLALEARRRAVEIEYDAADLPMVTTDPDALQQIVFNLVRNGITATEDSGTIRIQLAIEDSAGPSTLRLVVSDDGVGMSDEVRARAFDPFFTTRAAEGGVGLGLAVVRSLVERQKGSIEIVSPSSGGTRVIVGLPC